MMKKNNEFEFDMENDGVYLQKLMELDMHQRKTISNMIIVNLIVNVLILWMIVLSFDNDHKIVIGEYCDVDFYKYDECDPTEWEIFTGHLFSVASRLNNKHQIHPNDNVVYDWLRNILYKESKFDHCAVNVVSGAAGLIQWVPKFHEAPEGVSNQLEGIFDYFDMWLKIRHVDNRVDMYLCVLLPSKAPRTMNSKPKNVIFKKGTIAYKQNKGLDFNNDGWVSRFEISKFLKKI